MIPFFKLKPIKEASDFVLKKKSRGHHCCQISKQNVKTVISPLVSRPWGQGGCQKKQKTSRNSNFQVSAAVFQSELKNLQKRPKLIKKHKKNTISGRFFEVYSILAVDVTSTCNSEVFWLILHLKYEPFVQHMAGAEV